MKRSEAIKTILDLLNDDDLAVFSTGMICREAFAIKDRPSNFYMLGSMGLASAIGLGLALNTDKRVVVFDGDGALLMNLGILAQVGALQPKKLIHIVLDNGTYGSTGGQSSIARQVSIMGLARSCWYRNIECCSSCVGVRDRMEWFLEHEGLSFLHIGISESYTSNVGRVTIPTLEIKERFMKCIVS